MTIAPAEIHPVDNREYQPELSITGRSERVAGGAWISVSDPPAAVVLVVDDDGDPVQWTEGTLPWLESVSAGPARTKIVAALVARIREADFAPGHSAPVKTLVRTPSGWTLVQATRFEERGEIVVSVNRGTIDDAIDLLASNSGLTARECDVVRLLVEGLDTQAIVSRLFISKHTLQDHLKSIFRKTGVRTRLKLAALVTGSTSLTNLYSLADALGLPLSEIALRAEGAAEQG